MISTIINSIEKILHRRSSNSFDLEIEGVQDPAGNPGRNWETEFHRIVQFFA